LWFFTKCIIRNGKHLITTKWKKLNFLSNRLTLYPVGHLWSSSAWWPCEWPCYRGQGQLCVRPAADSVALGWRCYRWCTLKYTHCSCWSLCRNTFKTYSSNYTKMCTLVRAVVNRNLNLLHSCRWLPRTRLVQHGFYIQLNFVKANLIKMNNSLRRSESLVPNQVLILTKIQLFKSKYLCRTFYVLKHIFFIKSNG